MGFLSWCTLHMQYYFFPPHSAVITSNPCTDKLPCYLNNVFYIFYTTGLRLKLASRSSPIQGEKNVPRIDSCLITRLSAFIKLFHFAGLEWISDQHQLCAAVMRLLSDAQVTNLCVIEPWRERKKKISSSSRDRLFSSLWSERIIRNTGCILKCQYSGVTNGNKGVLGPTHVCMCAQILFLLPEELHNTPGLIRIAVKRMVGSSCLSEFIVISSGAPGLFQTH